MADHLGDEEQLEAIKRWWKQNGTSLVLLVVLGLGGWFGWHYWQDQKQKKAEQSSLVYMAMLDAVTQWEQSPTEESASAAAAHAETLKKLADNGLYGRLAAMTIARLAVADEEYDNAVAELEWAREGTDDEALKALLNLRLAEIEIARNNPQQALALIDQPHPEGFAGLYLELKGDILAAQGDAEGAKAAFQAALDKLDQADARARGMLELKMNEVMPATAADAVIEEEDA